MQNAIADDTRSGESADADLDSVTHALERLLARHQAVLKAEGMEHQVRNLKRWLEVNRKDFAAASSVSKTGNAWLSDLCNSLKLAVEERQRLESEGGIPATKEQAEQSEELLGTIRRIEKIVSTDLARFTA